MSWSLQVLNSFESTHRFYDFAGHILDQVNAAASGKGLVASPRHTRVAQAGELVSLPQWWLYWYEIEDAEVVGKGTTKLATLRDGGTDPTAVVGVVVATFWLDRASDRTPPELKPQLFCGRGTLAFREWGKSHDFKDYFTEFARRLNKARRSWPEDGLTGVQGHVQIGDDFVWLAPRAFEELTSGAQVTELAGLYATHLAGDEG